MESFLNDFIVPKTIKSGCFGGNIEVENIILENNVGISGQFASDILFVKLVIKDKNSNEIRSYDVIVKVALQNKEQREMINCSLQFRNEIYMYKVILPMLDEKSIVSELFCKFYYGYSDKNDPGNDFIVLEDLRKKNYIVSPQKVFLDYDHCYLSMKKIGKFHALSYMAKYKDLPKLLSLASKVEERWDKDCITSLRGVITKCMKRGIMPHIEIGDSVDLLSRLLEKLNDIPSYYEYLIKPVEPEAVLCHGDFNRNNILYLYDENFKPIDLKLIDLQTPRYSSPVTDLSFFLLMNTTTDLRKKYLNEFINIYKQSVLSTALGSPNIPELDFARVAIYGYVHCSFYLPVMMNQDSIDSVLITDKDELERVNSTRGGETATKVLADIVKDLLDNNYLRIE